MVLGASRIPKVEQMSALQTLGCLQGRCKLRGSQGQGFSGLQLLAKGLDALDHSASRGRVRVLLAHLALELAGLQLLAEAVDALDLGAARGAVPGVDRHRVQREQLLRQRLRQPPRRPQRAGVAVVRQSLHLHRMRSRVLTLLLTDSGPVSPHSYSVHHEQLLRQRLQEPDGRQRSIGADAMVWRQLVSLHHNRPHVSLVPMAHAAPRKQGRTA